MKKLLTILMLIVAFTATSFAKQPKQRNANWHKREKKILKSRATYGVTHACSINSKRNAWYDKHVKMQKRKEMWRKNAKNKRKKNKKSRF